MRALQMGMIVMNEAVASERIREALTRRVPEAADRVLKSGDEAMVYQEKDKVWYSGYIVKDVIGKQVIGIDRLGEVKHFSQHQVKGVIAQLSSNIQRTDSEEADEEAREREEVGIALDVFYNTHKFRSKEYIETSVPIYNTFVSETILKGDARYNSPEVRAAMKRDIDGLVEKGTWC
jgi:hypothetical protein